MEEKFNLRELCADDLFPMFGIVSKIGIREIKDCFNTSDAKEIFEKVKSGDNTADAVSAVGMSIALDVAGVVMANLPKCKDDIYSFLSGVSGMSRKDLASLSMGDFACMIIEVIKKPDFRDFFTEVTKYLK